MKLVYCIPSLEAPGGTERVLSNKVNYLAEYYGYDIYIVLTEKQIKSPYYSLYPSITVVNLNVNYNSIDSFNYFIKIVLYLIKNFVHKRRLSKLLYHIKPDVVTTLLSHEINFLYQIADGSRKVGECHFYKDFRLSFVSTKTTNRIKIAIAKWRNKQLHSKVKKLDCLVTLTKQDCNSWKGVKNKCVISNSLPFSSLTKSDCFSPKIIAVGRYTKEKGFDLLLRVWKEIYVQRPNWSLFIYGDGELREDLENYVRLNGLKNVYLEHSVKNIQDKYIHSSFLVLPSRFEGFGMVVIEAMECGLPVVAFDCPCGPAEIVSDGVDGFLVPALDLDMLKKKILLLIDSTDLRIKMGQVAVEKASLYLNKTIMKEWEQLYKSLLK